MTCLEAQTLITPFINDKLDSSQLEEFLKHVQSCPTCMEELEVYFALLTAMKQLDEDDDLSTDFKKELEYKLRHSEEKIIHEKLVHIRKRIVYIIMVCVIAVVSSIGVGAIEEVLSYDEDEQFDLFVLKNAVIHAHTDSMSDFRMKNYNEIMRELELKKEQEEEIREREEQRRADELEKEKIRKEKKLLEKLEKENQKINEEVEELPKDTNKENATRK